MTEPDPREVVRRFWEAVEAREWEAAQALFHDDAVVEWPPTGERFTSAASFIEMNRRHPAPNWHIRVKRIIGEGDTVVSEVWVPTHAEPAFVASFFEVEAGRIRRVVEYWADWQPEVPDWRADLRERYEPDA